MPLSKIFECYFGSQMYGTSTPSSDLDIKGVFIAPLRDIILNTAQATIVSKTNHDNTKRNTKDDVDTEYKELRTFLREAAEGQTYALDMLFCPQESVILTTDVWRVIQENRLKLLSKKCKPILGYIQGQCSKYAMKGTRLDAVEQALAWAQRHDGSKFVWECLADFPESSTTVDGIVHHHTRKDYKVTVKLQGRPVEQDFVYVIGAKYGYKLRVKYVRERLEEFVKKFGTRAQAAKENQGIDWKAVSHAVRLLLQADELATTGFVTFPLKERDFVLSIKQGKEDWNEINDWINDRIERVFSKIKQSSYLRDEPDYAWIEQFTVDVYLGATYD